MPRGRRGRVPSGRCPVSVEAISWALNLAPVPADRGGQPSTACKFVLAGLANHAGPDGAGAFPSVARWSAPRQSCSAVAPRPHRFICAAHCDHPL